MKSQPLRGHEKQIKLLKSIFESGKVPHTFIFSGIDGIGKRKIAEYFSAYASCAGKVKPCGVCGPCLQIEAGSFPDYLVLEKDRKGRIAVGEDGDTVGTVRYLLSRLSMKPVTGRYVVIIDGIDRMSESGQNALLKTIEEPLSDCCMFIVTSSLSLILPTIVSRSYLIKFFPIADAIIKEHLEKYGFAEDTREFISAASCGSFRNADFLSTEQISGDKLYYEGLLDFCGDLSASVCSGRSLFNDISGIAKKDKEIDVIGALIGLYSYMLRKNAANEVLSGPFFDRFFIQDREKLVRLLHVLHDVKRFEKRNINEGYALKSGVYLLQGVSEY